MPTLTNETMHLLEAAIGKYDKVGSSSSGSAVRDLLVDIRWYCDEHDIAIEDLLEESLDLYLEEHDDCGFE